MLLIIVGMPCAGKTTALEVCEEMGAVTVSSGNVIREEIERRGVEYNEETDREVAAEFHREGKEEELMRRVLEKVRDELEDGIGDSFVAIEGLRAVGQVEFLEEETGVESTVVAVEASFEERVDRCLVRERFPGEDEEYIRSRDEVEKERGLDELIENADYHLDTTDMTIEEFRDEFKKLVDKLREM